MDNLTTIRVKTATRDALAEIGAKNQTYDDIIEELITLKKQINTKNSASAQ